MASKLNLDQNKVDRARAAARQVALDTQAFIDRHTTVTVERAVCRLLLIDGVNEVGVPLPNVVVDHLLEKGLLSYGAAYALGNAMAETGLTPQQIAEAVDRGVITFLLPVITPPAPIDVLKTFSSMPFLNLQHDDRLSALSL